MERIVFGLLPYQGLVAIVGLPCSLLGHLPAPIPFPVRLLGSNCRSSIDSGSLYLLEREPPPTCWIRYRIHSHYEEASGLLVVRS